MLPLAHYFAGDIHRALLSSERALNVAEDLAEGQDVQRRVKGHMEGLRYQIRLEFGLEYADVRPPPLYDDEASP